MQLDAIALLMRGPFMLPSDPKARKATPIFTGVLRYFPDAIAAVAEVSRLGNEQHNPGEPLHWARGKSMDQTDSAVRHMLDNDRGETKDTDGAYHLAKAAWRILAELQLTIEKETTLATAELEHRKDMTDFTKRQRLVCGKGFDNCRYPLGCGDPAHDKVR